MAHTRSNPTPGAPRRTGAGHVVSYGEGRTCAAPECTVRLSRYNSAPYCAPHDARFAVPFRRR